MLFKVNQTPFCKEKTNLAIHPFFEELIFFLISKKNQPVTLKDIKKQFPTVSFLNSFIDKLIKFGIIERYQGKYCFSGVFITKENQQTMNQLIKTELDSNKKEIKDWINKYQEDKSDAEFSLLLLYDLFSECDDESLVVFEKTDLATNWLTLPTRVSKVNSKHMTLFSLVNFVDLYGNTITDYFNFLTLDQDYLPDDYWTIYNLLGDLNPIYFNQHAIRHLRRLSKGKSISNQKCNVFMEALFLMEYVLENGDSYYLTTTKLNKQLDKSIVKKHINQLENQFDSVEIPLSQKRFIVRSVYVKWLIDNTFISLPNYLHGMI